MTKQEFFNRYQFSSKDKIGGGSFGTVFKAYDRVKSVYVAIKKAPVKDVEGKTFSLKDEIDALSSLSLHPNIAIYETVYSFEGEGDVFDYAVMQHYPGGNLKELLASKNLTEQQKISILEGIISGLEHLHNNGVVHRDIKPSNILIAEYNGEYTPKITDFGLSKIAESEHQSRFTSSFAGGTLSYASPEQLLGKSVKFNTDVWSVGVIAYEMFTGKLPFQASDKLTQSAAKEQEIYNKIINANLPDNINSLPNNIGNLIRASLQKDPNNRLSNVSDLNSHLQKNTDNDQTIILGPSLEKETLAKPNSVLDLPKIKKESKGKIEDKSIDPNRHKRHKVLWLRAAFIVLSSIILLRECNLNSVTYFNEDKKDWEKALNENTLSSYQEYKNSCGKCGFRTEANNKIKALNSLSQIKAQPTLREIDNLDFRTRENQSVFIKDIYAIKDEIYFELDFIVIKYDSSINITNDNNRTRLYLLADNAIISDCLKSNKINSTNILEFKNELLKNRNYIVFFNSNNGRITSLNLGCYS